MGNGYNHHHFQYQQNLDNLQKSTFLPMLCSRTSIKDVALPRLEDPSASFSNDPLSPKIGCMGQVKRNNKITGFPTTSYSTNKLALTTTKSSSSNSHSNNDVKYFKLKRLFSSKHNNITSCAVSSCRRGRRREAAPEREVCINIAEMDPPLPVIKRVPKPADNDENKTLWKRRSNGDGGALKSLELQHIKIPKYQLDIQTV